MQNYHHLLLVAKDGHEPAQAFAHMLQKWLKAKNFSCQITTAKGFCLENFEQRPDLVIVLGGDGTMIGTGRHLAGSTIPLLGINFGTVGFLALAQQDNWEDKLLACLEGKLSLQSRLTLSWSIRRKASLFAQGIAINDVVVGHGALARLICVTITLDDRTLCSLRCDGIICASPTGSSGYTASAGGPVVFPDANVYAITPICPFIRSISPMVLPSHIVFTILIEENSVDTYLTVDGQKGYTLERGDIISVTGNADSLLLVTQDGMSNERLRTRGLAPW